MLRITRYDNQEIFITYGQGEDEIILGSFRVAREDGIIAVYLDFNKDLNILRREVLERRGLPLHDSRHKRNT